jgi:O-antigen ligase
MFAALLQAHAAGRRGETAFFALALAAAGLALTQNCSRQTFLAVPALCLLTLWVYRRHVRWKSRLVMALAVLFLAVIPPLAGGGGGAQRLLGSWEFGDGSAKILDVARRILWSGAPPEVPNATPLSVRLDLWKIGWDAFLDHPVLGQGPGSGLRGEIQSAEPEGGTRIITGRHAHNMFIDVLAHTGLAGFLGFLALHLAPLSLLWPHRRSPDPETFFWVWAALAVNLQLLLNGLTDQSFGLKPMMYIHWTVTAAGLWQTRESRREANNP